MKKLLLTSMCCLALVAGIQAADDQNQNTSPNNTAVNARDRSSDSLTSGDQSENKSDIQITAAIRRKVVHDKSLSMDAHNVKIITESGQTTLRGPVKSQEEKQKIGEYAQQVGATRVNNQLEIESAH